MSQPSHDDQDLGPYNTHEGSQSKCRSCSSHSPIRVYAYVCEFKGFPDVLERGHYRGCYNKNTLNLATADRRLQKLALWPSIVDGPVKDKLLTILGIVPSTMRPPESQA